MRIDDVLVGVLNRPEVGAAGIGDGFDVEPRIEIVEREGQLVVRLELQGDGAAVALAVVLLDGVIQTPGAPGLIARIFDVIEGVWIHEEVSVPVHGRAMSSSPAFLVTERRKHTQPVLHEAVAENECSLRTVLFAVLVILIGETAAQLQSLVIERLGSQHIDGAADAAFGNVGVCSLVDIDSGDQLGGDRVEAERAARVRAGDLPAIQQRQRILRPETVDADVASFAALAIDGDAWNTLQCFGQVVVRELADVLGGDAIDDAVGGLLGLQRLPD